MRIKSKLAALTAAAGIAVALSPVAVAGAATPGSSKASSAPAVAVRRATVPVSPEKLGWPCWLGGCL
jgi:hypothetical protein